MTVEEKKVDVVEFLGTLIDDVGDLFDVCGCSIDRIETLLATLDKALEDIKHLKRENQHQRKINDGLMIVIVAQLMIDIVAAILFFT